MSGPRWFGGFLVLVAALCCPACGGGGGGTNDAEALAVLQGSWFGPRLDGSLELVFDDQGAVLGVFEDDVATGLTGTIAYVGGSSYEGELSDGRLLRLFLDPTRSYAAVFGEFEIACLERGATTLPPLGFRVDDVAPAAWFGSNLVLDVDLHVRSAFQASVQIAADGTWSGTDSSGLVFNSPAGTMLAPFLGVLEGPYEDNVNPTTGFIELLPSPDLQFLVAVAYPITNTTLRNGQFIGAWNRD